MSRSAEVERRLAQWGDRLFYGMPGRGKRGGADPRLVSTGFAKSDRSSGRHSIRDFVRATVSSKATEVVVKITSGSKGMNPLAAHFRYISRQGKPEVGGKGCTLEVEDDRGNIITGAQGIKDLAFDWKYERSVIPDDSSRRESFNIILSMPGGVPARFVREAAREFARDTFPGHMFVFALHEDTDSPHVHLSVRAERDDGARLDPRKPDLRVWRERFAENLQRRGVVAVATPAAVRAQERAAQPIWRLKTKAEIKNPKAPNRSPGSVESSRREAQANWQGIAAALADSDSLADRKLAKDVDGFVKRTFGQKVQPPRINPEL